MDLDFRNLWTDRLLVHHYGLFSLQSIVVVLVSLELLRGDVRVHGLVWGNRFSVELLESLVLQQAVCVLDLATNTPYAASQNIAMANAVNHLAY